MQSQKKQTVKSLVESLASSFGVRDKERIEFYTMSLSDKSYGVNEIEDVFLKLAESSKEFPMLNDIYSLLSGTAQENRCEKEEIERADREKRLVDQARFNKLREQYVGKYGETKLDLYVKKWFTQVYCDPGDMDKLGIRLSLFGMPALFDLAAASGDEDKAIDIGKMKKAIVDEETRKKCLVHAIRN